jgi:undecaprenyl diphosphate synthase
MRDLDPERLPRHIAIIPDGNGRWAEARGLPRNEGHHRGCDVVRDIVEACHDIGIPMLTVYAFSEENWARPSGEVRALMRLLERYLRRETDELARKGLRVQAVGSIERLSPAIRKQLSELAVRTHDNRGMQVTFAVSYSGRTELVDMARKIARDVEAGRLDLESIDEKTVVSRLYAADLPDPDLLIRSGAEYRISNFLLWQMAYTELYFCDALWPDFTPAHLREALHWYQQRERRHGRTGAQVRSGV